MIKTRYLVLLSFIGALIGGTAFLLQRNLLIIHFPRSQSNAVILEKAHEPSVQKKLRFYYKKSNRWLFEESNILWQESNPANNVKHLIKQWLVVMRDEHLLQAPTILQSVAAAPASNQLYISFDQSLFLQQQSIMDKWLIIESLIKTIHESGLSVGSITLLINHKPWHDDHIELTQPLPIQEFLTCT